MLVKLDAKTARCKALDFHPKRPWILVALHSGAVQLWDYRMGSLLDEYQEHDGPVRGCAFHPSQPLFASCGDDYTVRVYNYRTRRMLFTLTGHMDYVRSVAFHPEAPWLMSASDDQTVRIWNWQSRQCISVLTGHSHYVMCAQFHPREDLVVSGSLDQTIRVWDVSGLRRKGSSLPGSPTELYPAALSPRSSGQLDLFAPPDGAVKYILEGHERGVNWVAFHPSRPLIASASDDRTVKIWRYNDIRVWELDTLKGHLNNVSCVVFHPKLDLVISDSEDKTLRIWDISGLASSSSHATSSHKKSQVIRKEERFWSLAAHAGSNLLAYGHDSGFAVFKLEKERPAFIVSEDVVYYFHDKVLKSFSLSGTAGKPQSLMTADHRIPLPNSLAHNPAEDIVLLSMNAESKYELYCLSSGDVKRGDGSFGVFTAKNRFALLDTATNTVKIMSIDNSLYRSINPEFKMVKLLQAVAGSLLLATEECVHWWDLQQSRSLYKLDIAGAKLVSWSPDNSHFAILTKSSIHLIDRSDPEGSHICIDETGQVKSAVWNNDQVLFFTNAHHLKYVLPNGDVGVVCTLEHPYYLLKVLDESVFVIDRSGSLQVITIDPAESTFKLALVRSDFTTVMQIIQSSPLVGQSIISYLRKNGYAEVALEFVKDTGSRFELAIEAGRLDMALLEAEKLANKNCWLRLGEEAVLAGDIEVAEAAFKNGCHDEKLSFLLLCCGQFEKLKRAEVNKGQRIHNSLLLCDWSSLCEALSDDSPALANVCRKNDQALSDSSMRNRDSGPLSPFNPTPITTAWPLTSELSQEKMFAEEWGAVKTFNQKETMTPVISPPEMANIAGWGVEDDEVLISDTTPVFDAAEEVESFEIVNPSELEQTLPSPGRPLLSLPNDTPFNCVYNGDYKMCKQLLTEKFGITEFESLLPIIEALIISCKVYLPDGSSYPFSSIDSEIVSPVSKDQLVSLHENALSLTTGGNFSGAVPLFREVFYRSLFASSDPKISKLAEEALEYLRGLLMELVRRDLPAGDTVRTLELACFFTHCNLRPEHHILSLRSAMTIAYKAECVHLAGKMAKRLLECDELVEQVSNQARKVLTASNRAKNDDSVLIEYDPSQKPFRICQSRLVQLHGEDTHSCQVCMTEYSTGGMVCLVCNLAVSGETSYSA